MADTEGVLSHTTSVVHCLVTAIGTVVDTVTPLQVVNAHHRSVVPTAKEVLTWTYL